MTVISFRPNSANINFLNSLDTYKTEIINKALENYRVYLLQKELREWFSKQNNEDLLLCNNDFVDYIWIISKNEL